MADVPNVAGVPAIVFDDPSAVQPPALTADAISGAGLLGAPQWGVYSDGSPVIVADTVLDLSHQREHALSNYPVEQGAFASYDKVQMPYQARIRFVAGGSPEARQALLSSVDAIVGDLNLYDVVMPEAVYSNANLVRRDFRRTAQDGVSLLMVDVILQEVRIAGGAAPAGAPASPSAAAQVNGGTVQAQDASVTLPFPVDAGL